jgi:hypothetical protein
MSAFRPGGPSSGLMGEILAAAGVRDADPSVNRADRYFLELSRLDYASLLRRMFHRLQIRALVAELKRKLPDLNRRVFSETNLDRLGAIAEKLGVEFQPRTFEGSEGVSLRGFYVNNTSVISRPLIVVNIANDPVAVAATFWHEMGHHLTFGLFGRASNRVKFNFESNYQNHLNDREELLADLVMVLAAYPKPIAQKIFGARPTQAAWDSPMLIEKARKHIQSVLGYEIEVSALTGRNLHVLASMIHAAKLREALLTEYGI